MDDDDEDVSFIERKSRLLLQLPSKEENRRPGSGRMVPRMCLAVRAKVVVARLMVVLVLVLVLVLVFVFCAVKDCDGVRKNLFCFSYKIMSSVIGENRFSKFYTGQKSWSCATLPVMSFGWDRSVIQ